MNYNELFTLADVLSLEDTQSVFLDFGEPTKFGMAFELTGDAELDESFVQGKFIYIFCEDKEDKIYIWHKILKVLPQLNLIDLMRCIRNESGDYRIIINCNED